MTDPTARRLMEAAWAGRRKALEEAAPERAVTLSEVRDALQRAVALAEITSVRAQALHLLAHVEVDLGNDGAAADHWRRSIGLLRDDGDTLGLAHKLRHLGDLQRARGELTEADHLLGESLGLYRSRDDAGPVDLANAIRRVGLLRADQRRSDAARSLFAEARSLYGAAGLAAGVAEMDELIQALDADTDAP